MSSLCRGTTEGANCSSCPFATAGEPTKPVVSEYDEDPAWLVIGEGPGFNEVRQGRPFVGASGQVVNTILKKIGRPREHLYIGNATLCMPPQGSPVEDRERAAECCKPRLLAELALFPGKPILTLGAVAARALIPKSVLDAIDPPDVPKTKKRAQKEKQKVDRKAERKIKAAIDKLALKRFQQADKKYRGVITRDLKRQGFKAPNIKYWDEPEHARARTALWKKSLAEAPREYEQLKEERALAKKNKPKKPKKKKPVKITDIVGTLFDIDCGDGSIRPVIPAIHPAALLRGGGATIGGSHTPDMAFVNVVYDAAKVDALAKGKNIRLRFDYAYEVVDADRANLLLLEALGAALDEGAYALDLETYVDDPDRHHALMQYEARIRVIGIATNERAVSVLWDFITPDVREVLQLVLARCHGRFHNGMYDRTVLRNKHHAFIIPLFGVDDDAPGFSDCYVDSETEFLTTRGWHSYDKIDHTMKLATIDRDGRLEWQRYTSRISKPYKGRALVFETNHTRAVVTPNHRMWCQPLRRTGATWRGLPMAPWGFMKADEMLSASTDSFAIRQACSSPTNEATPSEALLQLLGVWLADGSLTYYKGKPYEIRISQKKNGRASKLLRKLATRFSLVVYEKHRNEPWRKRSLIEECWHLNDPQLATEFALLGRYSRVRKLPPEAFSWSAEARRVFLEALFLGDGSQHGGRADRFIYRSGSEALADGVQALALSIGWAATNPKTYRPDGICHVFISRNVDLTKSIRTRLNVANSCVDEIKVDDRKVCFSVPNETLITRSRGKPAFYGNSLLAHHAAFPGNSHKLQMVTAQFLGVGAWKSEFKNADETPEKLAIYNAKDTASTNTIVPILEMWVKKTDTERVYEVDRVMSDIASRMHLHGQPVSREVNTQLVSTFSRLARDAKKRVEAQASDPKVLDRIKHKLALMLAAKERKKDIAELSYVEEVARESNSTWGKAERFESLYKMRKRDLEDEAWYWKINNSKHIAAFLQALDVPLTQVTDGGAISTKREVLESLVDVPVVRDMLEYRENEKMKDFTVPIFDRFGDDGVALSYGFADGEDRIHPLWSIHKISGRWAGSEPMGTSNPPREKTKKVPFGSTLASDAIITGFICECGKYDRDKHEGHTYKPKFIEYAYRPTTKRQIVTRNGRVIIGFDFAQVEARIIALISGDPFMCDVFGRDGDLHTECAIEVFPGFLEKTPSERKMARTVCKTLEYATWYGANDEKVWKGLLKEGYNFKLPDVVGSLNRIRKKMSGVLLWQRETIARASQPPYELRDFVLGRRRVWPMGNVEASEALNIVPQATGAALMGEGMWKMDLRLPKYQDAFWISQIHDAAYIEAWEDDADAIATDLNECFTTEKTNPKNGKTVKFSIEVGIGQSMADV